MSRWAVLLFWLAVWTVQDIRKREISVWQIAAAAVMALLWRQMDGDLIGWDTAGVMVLGSLGLGLGFVSKGRFGTGDGAVILCMGLYLGTYISLSALVLALLLTVPAALYLLVCRGGSRDTAIPFVPFLLAGAGMVLLCI